MTATQAAPAATIEPDLVEELFQKVRRYPPTMVEQMTVFANFLEFQQAKARIGEPATDIETEEDEDLEDEDEFTEEELAELDRRVAEYEADPDSAIPIEEYFDWVKQKYGI